MPPHNAAAAMIAGDDLVTALWLTTDLRAADALPTGQVSSVTERPNAEAFNSIITHLTVAYSPDAPADTPRRLLLKRNLSAAWAVRDAAREVAFYQLVMSFADSLPMLVRCYGAAFDAAHGVSYLLLADLSETHVTPISREQVLALDGVPSEDHVYGVIDALAQFHAYWWEHPLLGQAALPMHGWYRDRAAYDTFIRDATANWERFIAAEGATFPDDLRALYEHALSQLPRLWDRYLGERIASRRNQTLSNEDSYFAQFLCPRDSAGRTFIIDFQNPNTDLAALDLVYLFATFWTPAQRAERESRLLRRYHHALQAHGVDYDWDELIADYRLMIIHMIFFPLWDQVNGSRRAYWWPKMQCLTGAYRDLDCANLLET
ncbi:MAG: oxidoreductase family protein [Thermomicrobiales bacterium]